MSNVQTVTFDVIRTLGYASITGTYLPVGGPFANPCRLICFTNDTDGDMFFSTDGVNDMLFIPAGAFKLFDMVTNRFHRDQQWVLPKGTQIYVRYNTIPSMKAVYVEVLWGQ
jgi:hypothetical protein